MNTIMNNKNINKNTIKITDIDNSTNPNNDINYMHIEKMLYKKGLFRHPKMVKKFLQSTQ